MSDNIEKDSQSILCDMCIGEDRKPARKTCMKCEISMCVQHLQAHLTTPVLLQTHPLAEPMALDASTKCPQHGKLLEYFCLDDMTCVCVSCAIEDQHRLHNMKTFTTAHKELMDKLQTEQLNLRQKTDNNNVSLEKWEKNEREKVSRCSVRLIEAVTNLRDISLSSVQSSVSARMVSLKTSRSSMQAAQKETDTFRFLQMYSQVHQDVEKAKTVDLRKGLEPGSDRDKLVQEIRNDGDELVKQVAHYMESLLILVDPEDHKDLSASAPDLIFEPQIFGPTMSLSKDKRKIFHHSWQGECSATLQIGSTQSAPNFQRWTVGLTKESDWMVGLCNKQSVNNLMNGPLYALRCEDNHLSFVTTKYNDPSSSTDSEEETDLTTSGNQIKICFKELKYKEEDIDKEIQQPEKVEVFWDIVGSKLSFFRRTGQYQREEIITIKMKLNSMDLVPFIQLGKQNTQGWPQQTWQCPCGKTYNKDINGYRDTCDWSRSLCLGNCSCGRVLGGPSFTEEVCEIV